MNNHTLEIFTSKLTPSSILVYLYLERNGARRRQCYHSIKTIASSLNLSPRTISRALNELEHNHFIIRTHRYRKNGGKSSNLYQILK